ncbi:ParB/RepB/Spo0J family partition protein [Suttonella sp. R2A3]|uniref:ParB/RepB/Spo0J family partition protein n=1 Tax=Suttonella sp. R2A3 TaxID=2908648 RepID=UPI001F22490E|nr:ParB/RepB/Spo0J family partition protein [Suttonella sp. R2A3]UJF23975.1 ParB/RepB/Spo0J family partition protein [Suttonella sp. R2A3]
MSGQNKRGLGKSLDALIGDLGQSVLDQPEYEVLKHIEVGRIEPGKYQPRKRFDDEALSELAHSIAEHGILQPLVVRPIGSDRYEIIAGERRFRAGQQAGLTNMPCVIKNYSDKEALAVALIENLQRNDLNAMEVAQGLQRLVEDFSLTHDRVAQLVGRSRSSISNTLRLLELGEVAKQALTDGEIEMGHARAMLPLGDKQQQALLGEIKQKHLTVRQTEARVRTLLQPEVPAEKPTSDTNIEDLQTRLSDFLQTNVSINHKKKGNGKVVLKYRDLDELDQLLNKWGFKEV